MHIAKLLILFIALSVFNLVNTQAKIIFLDGTPASGKSTLACEIKNQLQAQDINTILIESDEIALSLNPNTPPWSKGVLLAIECAQFLAKSTTKDTIIIVDAFLWKELYDQLSPHEFHFVLMYAPLELILHRFAQRAFCSTQISQERIAHLFRDFLNLYFVANNSENQVIAHYSSKENLYTHRRYDLIAYSATESPTVLAQQVINSFSTRNLFFKS